MKYNAAIHLNAYTVSPSMRREWIEMLQGVGWSSGGGCLPPCGGSGLKSFSSFSLHEKLASPSMRREWIEMSVRWHICRRAAVSLHAEGVD